MDCSCQAPLSTGFPRQEYWSGMPCHPAGDPLTQGLNLRLLHWQVDSSLLSTREAPVRLLITVLFDGEEQGLDPDCLHLNLLFTRCVTLACYLTSPWLSFLIWKMEITTVPVSWSKFINIKQLPWWLSRKNLPASARDVGLILGREDPLEKKMATHSSILA